MRTEGHAPIEAYALIGDGRTAALVARDGAIDWLCLPNLDSPSVFAGLLDPARGGVFEFQPSAPFSVARRYIADTNVLETTFTTAGGVVRVVDALTIPDRRLSPMRELVRAVTGVDGTVPMRWRVAPRFEYGARAPRAEWRGGVPVATWGGEAIAVAAWDAGRPAWREGAIEGSFDAVAGRESMLAMSAAYAEPLVVPSRADVKARLDRTIAFWREWATAQRYSGRWAEAVVRSALTLKLLIFAPSGASVAAPTTSLPEELGGERNWDYRFCWIRDSNFMIDALLRLGCYDEAWSLFWWFMQATALTEPEVQVLYRLDGGIGAPNDRSISRGIGGRGRCASATARWRRCSTTSMARCSKRRGCIARGTTRSTATRGVSSAASPITCAPSGAVPTRASGRSATARFTSRTRR